MKLIPFILVDAVPFTATRAQVLAHYGAPLLMQRNGVGLNELNYGDWVARFQDSGRLEEVTMQVPVLSIHGHQVAFDALSAFVQAHDVDMFERGGFWVSPRLGFAFVPGRADWVTALAAHCIESWRSMGQQGQ